MDRFDYSRIRPDITESLDRYGKDGVPVGGFLTAVLSNDLIGAVARADSDNLPLLPIIATYAYDRLPAGCCGSHDRVVKWIKDRRPK